MKKSIILFILFFVADFIMYVVLCQVNYGKDFDCYFLPAIFLEIAIYGSVIIYEITKKGDDNDD